MEVNGTPRTSKVPSPRGRQAMGGVRRADALGRTKDVSGGSPVTVMLTPVFDWDNEDWRDQAACRSSDPELFFPSGSTGPALEQIRVATSICRSCPAQVACLQFALETNQEAGIWGGTDEDERRKMRRAWRAGRRLPKGVMT